ncbi:SDR family NAD(P)-dependent oxidoreductase [Salinicola corii]|uniref:SDR family NAD(P)-dependent oxidoreductase n=1 Tax=Salinicola corii TaxID=2606937 RepID=A0A640WBX3_9GAMM|nr:oxidoreductase [Salinicola corii]KAA0016289.1 SDR family NAD(P)-dependent oxidoreductase [Salinicola corii]
METSAKPVVLVTGASSGMGKDFALRLLKEGYVVYGAARRVERMRDIVEAGGVALNIDVSDERSIGDGVARIIADQGRIDVLINNAGYGQHGAIEDVPIELARGQMEVNLFGLARLTQLCLPHMRARGHGRIVNISSIGGKITTPLGGWYHASKFALEGWSDVLRNEVRAFGIEVVVIEPGGIESEWSDIATHEAVRLSGKGAYANLVQAFAKAHSGTKAPPPSVITELVMRALQSRRPRSRYAAGFMAKPLLLLRRILSDWMFDRLIMSAFR